MKPLRWTGSGIEERLRIAVLMAALFAREANLKELPDERGMLSKPDAFLEYAEKIAGIDWNSIPDELEFGTMIIYKEDLRNSINYFLYEYRREHRSSGP